MQIQEPITFFSADTITVLEGRWLAPEKDGAAVAVLAHHLPTMSNMDQRAIFSTFKELRGRGWGVLRYNSRGVGGSAGEYSGGAGEDLDLAGAVAEARRRSPNSRIALIGWSFGAERVLRLMKADPAMIAAVAITPNPAALNDNAREQHGPLLVIVAERDELFELEATRIAFDHASEPKTWLLLAEATHLYLTREAEVARATADWLEAHRRASGA